MKIKLSEIQLIIKDKEESLRDIYSLRTRSLTDTFRIDSDTNEEKQISLPYEESVENLTDMAIKLENDILYLKSVLSKANNLTILDYKYHDKDITLQEGIILIKTMRNNLNNIKYLADMKEDKKIINDTVTINGSVKGYTEIVRPSYNVEIFKNMYGTLKMNIRKLEIAITGANSTVDVEIDDKFIGE